MCPRMPVLFLSLALCLVFAAPSAAEEPAEVSTEVTLQKLEELSEAANRRLSEQVEARLASIAAEAFERQTQQLLAQRRGEARLAEAPTYTTRMTCGAVSPDGTLHCTVVAGRLSPPEIEGFAAAER